MDYKNGKIIGKRDHYILTGPRSTQDNDLHLYDIKYDLEYNIDKNRVATEGLLYEIITMKDILKIINIAHSYH
jgi:hypothetical protein